MAPLDRTGGRGAGRSGRGRSFRGGGAGLGPTRTGQPRQRTEAGSPGWYEARRAGGVADVNVLERQTRVVTWWRRQGGEPRPTLDELAERAEGGSFDADESLVRRLVATALKRE